MNCMKKIFSIFFSIIFLVQLTGCFGGGDSESDVGVSVQKFQNFTISVPADWRKILKADFANTIPEMRKGIDTYSYHNNKRK